jgi:hypothetical protein
LKVFFTTRRLAPVPESRLCARCEAIRLTWGSVGRKSPVPPFQDAGIRHIRTPVN